MINKTLLIEISQKDNHNELIKREQCFTRGKKKRLTAVMNVSQCVNKNGEEILTMLEGQYYLYMYMRSLSYAIGGCLNCTIQK